jgi:hypothetical protein
MRGRNVSSTPVSFIRVPPEGDDTRTRLAELLTTARDLTLRNVTAITAAGALSLYLVGLFRRLGQLNAEGIDPRRGLTVTSLQDYLLDGAAVVVATLLPVAFVALGLGVVASAVPRIAERLWPAAKKPAGKQQAGDQPPPASTQWLIDRIAILDRVRSRTWWRRLERVAILLLVVAFVPLEFLAAFLALGFVIWALVMAWRRMNAESESRRSGIRFVTTLALGYLLLLAVQAYVLPTPLDRLCAITTDRSHSHFAGPFLGQTNASFYVVGQRPNDGGSYIRAMPAARIRAMRIIEGKPKRLHTIAERYLNLSLPTVKKYAGDYPTTSCFGRS